MRSFVFRSITVLLIAASSVAAGASPAAAADVPPGAAARVVAAMNAERANHGLAPLVYVGGDSAQCAADAYRASGNQHPPGCDWSEGGLVGMEMSERTGNGDASAARSWVSSPSHAVSLLNSGASKVRVGVACGTDGTMFIVAQVLGDPFDPSPSANAPVTSASAGERCIMPAPPTTPAPTTPPPTSPPPTVPPVTAAPPSKPVGSAGGPHTPTGGTQTPPNNPGKVDVPVKPGAKPGAKDPSCTDLGRTNIAKGEVGYRPALDADNDGVACESNGEDAAAPGNTTSTSAPAADSDDQSDDTDSNEDAAATSVVPSNPKADPVSARTPAPAETDKANGNDLPVVLLIMFTASAVSIGAYFLWRRSTRPASGTGEGLLVESSVE